MPRHHPPARREQEQASRSIADSQQGWQRSPAAFRQEAHRRRRLRQAQRRQRLRVVSPGALALEYHRGLVGRLRLSGWRAGEREWSGSGRRRRQRRRQRQRQLQSPGCTVRQWRPFTLSWLGHPPPRHAVRANSAARRQVDITAADIAALRRHRTAGGTEHRRPSMDRTHRRSRGPPLTPDRRGLHEVLLFSARPGPTSTDPLFTLQPPEPVCRPPKPPTRRLKSSALACPRPCRDRSRPTAAGSHDGRAAGPEQAGAARRDGQREDQPGAAVCARPIL